MMLPMTTNKATGRFLRNTLPSSKTARAARPRLRDAVLVSLRCERKWPERSQKLPCEPLKPKSFGNCVLARNSATPHLKPIMTLSEMKLTIEPALASQATNAMTATSNAVPAASAPKRVMSPPVISPNDAPTSSEITDVTVTAVWRELQKSQKTSPEKRQA